MPKAKLAIVPTPAPTDTLRGPLADQPLRTYASLEEENAELRKKLAQAVDTIHYNNELFDVIQARYDKERKKRIEAAEGNKRCAEWWLEGRDEVKALKAQLKEAGIRVRPHTTPPDGHGPDLEVVLLDLITMAYRAQWHGRNASAQVIAEEVRKRGSAKNCAHVQNNMSTFMLHAGSCTIQAANGLENGLP